MSLTSQAGGDEPRDGGHVIVGRPLAAAPPEAERRDEPVVSAATVGALAVGVGMPHAAAVRVRPPLHHITLAFSGDTLPHSPIVDQAWRFGDGLGFDFRPMFAEVAPIIGWADLAICHLETPVAPMGEALSTAPVYGVPAEITAGIAAAGYDRCSTASNHSLDRRVAGIDATVAALEQNGLGQSGMARTPEESIAPIIDVRGVAVAHLSYAYGFNGFSPPPTEPWRVNLIDPSRIVADALDARARGADVVVVSLHWGVERVVEPTQFQRDVATAVTESGAVDLIVGHHAHVLQPIEQVNGRWVVYGLGNFLSNMPTGDQWPASSQDGAVLTVAIDEQPDGSFVVATPVVHPTWVDRDGGWVIRPVLTDLADPSLPAALHDALAGSLARTAALLGPFIAPT